MRHLVSIYVDGVPGSKGRPKMFRTRTGIGSRTPAKTAAYEERLAHVAKQQWKGEPVTSALRLVVVAVFPPQSTMRGVDRQLAHAGELWHTSRPDLDNVVKIVCDALNKLVWVDDAQVAQFDARKQFGPNPGLWIEVYSLD